MSRRTGPQSSLPAIFETEDFSRVCTRHPSTLSAKLEVADVMDCLPPKIRELRFDEYGALIDE